MVVKSKEYFEKTIQVRYHERILSNKTKSNNFVNFLEECNRYRAEIFSVN